MRSMVREKVHYANEVVSFAVCFGCSARRVTASSRPHVVLSQGSPLYRRSGRPIRLPELSGWHPQALFQVPQVLRGILKSLLDNGQVLCCTPLAGSLTLGSLLEVTDIHKRRIAEISKQLEESLCIVFNEGKQISKLEILSIIPKKCKQLRLGLLFH